MNLFSFFKGTNTKNIGSVSSQTQDIIKKEWENINILLNGKTPSQLRQALISADKTLDNALRDAVNGETMGERLQNAKEVFDFTTYDKLWKAHKVRNNIVHESGYEPPYFVVKEAVDSLRKGLKALGIYV